MKWLILALCFASTAWELYNDRNGEDAKGKVLDGIILVVAGILIAGLSYLLGESWVAAILLILGIRIMFFDYLITIILYKRGVIERPEARKWWSYLGSTSKAWDRIAAKVPWKIRLIVRIAVFVASIALFFASGHDI